MTDDTDPILWTCDTCYERKPFSEFTDKQPNTCGYCMKRYRTQKEQDRPMDSIRAQGEEVYQLFRGTENAHLILRHAATLWESEFMPGRTTRGET